MSDLVGNHIVGFPTRQLRSLLICLHINGFSTWLINVDSFLVAGLSAAVAFIAAGLSYYVTQDT